MNDAIVTPSATLSFELRAAPRITMSSPPPPPPLRSWLFAGAAVVSGLVFVFRKNYSDGVRRRVVRRLDIVAPRTRFCPQRHAAGDIINSDCPVCLCDLQTSSHLIRVLPCRHALCADCLEAWATHCTKSHLNPARFGITRAGRVVAWSPAPKCPLCCAALNCVPKEDLRQAVIAAVSQRGVALSTFVAFHEDESPGGDAAVGGVAPAPTGAMSPRQQQRAQTLAPVPLQLQPRRVGVARAYGTGGRASAPASPTSPPGSPPLFAAAGNSLHDLPDSPPAYDVAVMPDPRWRRRDLLFRPPHSP